MKNSLKLEIDKLFVGDQLLTSIANDEYTYYGIFKNFLVTRDNSLYKKHIIDEPSTYANTPNALESTKFKALIIINMTKYDIDYGQSYQISSESDEYLSLEIDAALDIVLSNYLYMLDAKVCWPGTIVIDADGRYSIQEGIHRQIINLVNGFSVSNFFIANRSAD
jgi:hypothetical protein